MPEKDQSMGAFGIPTQVLPIVLTSADHLYDRKVPHKCPILHLMGHHLFDRSSRRHSQCHFCRATGQVTFARATKAAYPDVDQHHYDNVQH